MSDLIDRQAAIDAIVQCTNCGDEDTLRKYVLKHNLDNGWTGGILDALNAVKDLPTVQPEPTDIDAREAVYNLAEKIGIHQLFALTVELRGEPIQPEAQWIPCSERMPEDYVDVLVWFEYFRYGDYNCMYATHGIGNYSKEYNSWTINHETGWKDLRVLAWMPLPEAYKPNK